MSDWRLNEIMSWGKITNRELAQRLGKHETTVSRMKTADVMPKMDGNELKKLCHVLNEILHEKGYKIKITYSDLLKDSSNNK